MAKLYTKNTWTDELLAGDERYNIKEDDGTPIESNVQIDLATSVATAGTAITAARMNNIENGIDDLDDAIVDLENEMDDVETTLDVPNLAEKTSPVDNDLFLMFDSEDSNNPKKIKGVNMPGSGGSGGGRTILTANKDYYVRTDGSDSNDGSVNDSSHAFLTIQKAIDEAAALDTSIYDVTIHVADGTYVSDTITCKDILGSGEVTIKGNSTTPSNVVIDGGFLKGTPGTVYTIQDMKFIKSSGTATKAFSINNGAYVKFGNVVFGSGLSYHLVANDNGNLEAVDDYSIEAGCVIHVAAEHAKIKVYGKSITVSSGLTFSSKFASSSRLGFVAFNASTFSTTTATGKKYEVTMNSIMLGPSAGFPGNTSGTTATGGQYS